MPEINTENALLEATSMKARLERMRARQKALREPFEESEIRWKPQAFRGSDAMAIAYIDSSLVMQRLDEVYGHEGWVTRYEVMPNGSVVCSLSVLVEGEWITKQDVGSPSEQPDEHDRVKAGFSDALKRAARNFGIGRFLYRLPQQYLPYDKQKKCFTRQPFIGLTEEQREEITARAKTCNLLVASVCAISKRGGLDLIPLGWFARVCNWLDQVKSDSAYINALNQFVVELNTRGGSVDEFCKAHKIKSLTELDTTRLIKATAWLKSQAEPVAPEEKTAKAS